MKYVRLLVGALLALSILVSCTSTQEVSGIWVVAQSVGDQEVVGKQIELTDSGRWRSNLGEDRQELAYKICSPYLIVHEIDGEGWKAPQAIYYERSGDLLTMYTDIGILRLNLSEQD